MARFWTYMWDVFTAIGRHMQPEAALTALILVYERLFGQIPRRVFSVDRSYLFCSPPLRSPLGAMPIFQ